MSRNLSASLLAFVCLSPLAARAAEPPPPRGPISVFVRARPDEAEPTAEQKAKRKAAADAADKEFDQVFGAYRKQFGKDASKWPEEKLTESFDALDRFAVAWSEHYYFARPAKEKADSVEDTKKYLGKDRKAAWVVLADSPESADLVIEILGRRGQAKFVTGSKYLAFDVLPGKIGADRLMKLSRKTFKTWFDDRLLILHWAKAKPKEPYLRFQVENSERWQDVAAFIGHTLEELAKTYYADLKP